MHQNLGAKPFGKSLRVTGCGGREGVSVFTFFSADPSSNPVEAYCFLL